MGGGQNFLQVGPQMVPFRSTRVAYLNQQVAANLKNKRSSRQIGLLFSEFSVYSKKEKKVIEPTS